MKKYLFFILLSIYFQCDLVAHATSIAWIGTSTPAVATDCDASNTNISATGTHWLTTMTYSATAATSGVGWGCTSHKYYTSGDHIVIVSYNNWWITSCPSWERAVAYNGGSNMTCRKYDDTAPLTSDITYVCPVNELAINSKTFIVTVNSGWQAPITGIDTDLEQANNPAAYDLRNTTVASSTLTFAGDISKVDGSDRDVVISGGRQYWFRIIRLDDEAGNSLVGNFAAPLKNCDFNVYSNTQNITTKQVGSHTLASTKTADWQSQPMSITLKDTYGNSIIPASGIGRTVDFNFNTNNFLYLDQYTRSGQSSAFMNIPWDVTFMNNRIALGTSVLTPIDSQPSPSNDGVYPFNFKIYTPTYQNYKADPNGVFKINNITFDINGSLGAITTQSITSSTIDFNFKPLYETAITGDLNDGGFIEGARQDSVITVAKNSSLFDGINPTVQLEFGGTDSSKFKLYGWTNTSLITGNNVISSRSDISAAVTFPSSTTNLYTKLIQNSASVWSSSNTYLSTHIAYTLDWYPILYNSDIIGKGNYQSFTNTQLTQQNGLKALWLVSTQKSNELVTSQFPANVNILGTSDKFTNKAGIIKNAILFSRNIAPDNGSKTITVLNGSNPGWGKELSNVLYFWNLSGAKVTLGNGSDVQVSGKKTILIIWGNLYIKNNIYYNSLANDMLGIIVIKDAEGNGGNIYIDPSITNISGTLFAEKSLISYNGTIELDGNTSISTLKNQLLIYGNVFSENTIGGSRKTTPQCPFYITSSCTTAIAQKYDLNYLRRYYLVNNLYPYGNGIVIGWWTCNGTSTCSLHNWNLLQTKTFTTTSSQYASYPVIIEYNSNIQKNPPPLFSLK